MLETFSSLVYFVTFSSLVCPESFSSFVCPETFSSLVCPETFSSFVFLIYFIMYFSVYTALLSFVPEIFQEERVPGTLAAYAGPAQAGTLFSFVFSARMNFTRLCLLWNTFCLSFVTCNAFVFCNENCKFLSFV